MLGCPDCGADDVISVHEFREVLNWRAIVTEGSRTYRDLAGKLGQYGIMPAAPDTSKDVVCEWVRGEIDRTNAPAYVCVNCVSPQLGKEVDR